MVSILPIINVIFNGHVGLLAECYGDEHTQINVWHLCDQSGGNAHNHLTWDKPLQRIQYLSNIKGLL